MILAERSGEVEIVGSPVASIIASVKELDGKIGQIGKENGEHFDTGDDRKFFGSRVAFIHRMLPFLFGENWLKIP